MQRSTGNQFAPIPPEVDAQGATATEFLERMFECEYCHECGQDADAHVAVIDPFGNWFAYCLDSGFVEDTLGASYVAG